MYRIRKSAALLLLALSCAFVQAQDSVSDEDKFALERLLAMEATQTSTDLDKYLRQAAYRHLPKTIEWLLQKGASPDHSDEQGLTALMAGIQGAEKRVDMEQRTNTASALREQTRGEQAVIKILLRNVHNIDARDKYGSTALLHAAVRMRFDIVQILQAAGADLNARNARGESTVSFAGKNDLADLAKRGADIRATDEQGQTILHRAMDTRCDADLRQYVQEAIKLGVKDTQDAKGQWASELPGPAFCPIWDFGPNGFRDHLKLIETVRSLIKATR